MSTAPPKLAAAEALYTIGYELYTQEKFAEAAAAFRLMLHVAPQDERSWLGLGECHERIEQYRVALELYSTGALVAEPSTRCELARERLLNRASSKPLELRLDRPL